MTINYFAGGIDLSNTTVRLGKSTPGYISSAEGGTLGSESVPVDDPGGTLQTAIVGNKPFYITETACSVPRLWTGWIGPSTIARGQGTSLITGVQRHWDATLIDLNAAFSFFVFDQAAANRPAETDIERINWMLGQRQLADIHDGGLIDRTSPANVDALDLRGLYPLDVFSGLSSISGKDYWVYWNDLTGLPSLFYYKSTANVFNSTLAISNVLADIDNNLVWYPQVGDSGMLRDPSKVYSGVRLAFGSGGNSAVYVTNPTTAATYGPRDVAISSSRIGKLSTATNVAHQFLAASSAPVDRITCVLKLPASKVNLVVAGHRITSKFSHLPGYESGVSMRVAHRAVAADEETDQFYNVTLELVLPIETNYLPFGLGSGKIPDLPSGTTPVTTPACLTSLGSIGVVTSADGTYPVAPCGTYDNVVASRLFCHDENVGNPCGLGSALFWGVNTNGREQKTLSYTPPAGAVSVHVTAHVSWDNSGSGGSATAHGWHINVVDHPPSGWTDGQTFLASSHPLSSTDMTEITADIPANLFDGRTVYFVTYPSWQESERTVCGSESDPFPGGGYLSTGAVDSLTFMGLCDGATGTANWVGGVGAIDGANPVFILQGWDGTGTPQAKVNGLPTPVTADPTTGAATFAQAPAAGSLVTFDYSVGANGAAPPPYNPGSIQALINAASPGDTVTVTPGTYTAQDVLLNKAITLVMTSCVLDGGGTQTHGIDITAAGAILNGGTVQNVNNPLQTGAVSIQASNVTIENGRTTANAGAGVEVAFSATNTTITNWESDLNVQEGYCIGNRDGSPGVATGTWSGGHVHNNNPNLAVSPGWEAGGGKTRNATGWTFDGMESDHNGGPGIWFDFCAPTSASVVKNCKVHHNQVGIMFEISDGLTCHNNAVWENGWTNGTQNWGWDAGILISSSANAVIYSNTLGWNEMGLSVVSQNRSGSPTVTGNNIHDNIVTACQASAPDGSGLRMQCWFQDWAGVLFSDTTNKDSGNNQFYSTLASPSSGRYWYNGSYSTVAAFAATTGGTGCTEISSGTALAALTAAGIPTVPEH